MFTPRPADLMSVGTSGDFVTTQQLSLYWSVHIRIASTGLPALNISYSHGQQPPSLGLLQWLYSHDGCGLSGRAAGCCRDASSPQSSTYPLF